MLKIVLQRPVQSIALTMAVALAFRLFGITTESAWNDEVLTLKFLGAPTLAAYLHGCFAEDPVPAITPVYYLVQYAWASLFGASILSARILSVLLGVLAVPLVAWLGRLVSNSRSGVTAAALFTLSMVQVYFAQEVRFYALLNVEALLSSIALVSALQRPAFHKWGVYVLANMALMFTHAFTPLLFLAQGIYLVWHWRSEPVRFAVWVQFHLMVAAAFLLWARYGVDYDLGAQVEVFNDVSPTWREIFMALVVFAGGRFSNENPASYMPGGYSLDLLIAVAVAFFALFKIGHVVFRRNAGLPQSDGRSWTQFDSLAFLVVWLLAPIIVLFAVSIFWKPMFLYRYVLHAAIPLTILAGMGIQSVQSLRLRRAVIALLLTMLAWQNLALPRPMRPDFQAFAKRVEENDPGAAVLALKPFVARPTQYALGAKYKVDTLIGVDEVPRAARVYLDQNRPVWLVLHRWSAINELEIALRDQGTPAAFVRLPGIPPLVVGHVDGPASPTAK